MGTYISNQALNYFMSSSKNLVEKRAIAIYCSKRKIKCGKLDLDAHHRALRIMTKCGYMKSKEMGPGMEYTLTPKGIALYDSLFIALGRP